MSMRSQVLVEHHGVATGKEMTTWQTLRRGSSSHPSCARASGSRCCWPCCRPSAGCSCPFVVQRTTDNGILAAGGPDMAVVARYILIAARRRRRDGVLRRTSSTSASSASSESGLATLRLKAFRHIHDLSMLTQNTERRGSLVSRVTSRRRHDLDVRAVRRAHALVSTSRRSPLATVLMVVYSPLLGRRRVALLRAAVRHHPQFQGIVGRAYTRCASASATCSAPISESVVGAATIRAYGVEDRTAAAHRRGRSRRTGRPPSARRPARSSRSPRASSSSGLTTAVVLVVGTLLARTGSLTLGELLAFLFLVNLFTQPVQQATEILNEMQNAVAGWRRVIGIIDTPADVADPGESGATLPRGPITVDFDGVGFAYPGGEPVLHDVDLTIAPRSRVAIVGETGSGKSTLAKLLTRLMDPTEGRCSSTGSTCATSGSPRCAAGSSSCRRRASSSTATLLDNVRFGRPEATDEDVRLTPHRARPRRLARRCPGGLATPSRAARRVAVGRGAAAGRARPGLPRRPRPARPRRGHLRGRPDHRGAPPASPRRADPRAHVDRHRAPALDRRGRRRGHRRRRRAHRRARSARRAGPRRGRLLGLHASWVAQQQADV